MPQPTPEQIEALQKQMGGKLPDFPGGGGLPSMPKGVPGLPGLGGGKIPGLPGIGGFPFGGKKK
jgi:signal recognition particle subunit SRP54